MMVVVKRRNHNPNEVRVKSNGDFAHLSTLDERTEALVENRCEVFIHNVEYLLHQHNITQTYMCNKDLEGSPRASKMAEYKKAGKDIPYHVIARVANRYGYTPEQMCGQLLDHAERHQAATPQPLSRPASEYRKYIGTYHVAYTKTDATPGTNKRTTTRDLAYGLLSVYAGSAVNGVPTLRVAAFLNCTDEERHTLVCQTREAEEHGGGRRVRSCYEQIANTRIPGTNEMPRMKCFYEGELTLTERIAEITIRQVQGGDIAHISLHNRAATSSVGSQYKGGLATMMSTSRGVEHMPCVQAAVLSWRGFDHIAKEELAHQLYLQPTKFDLQDEVREIIRYTKMLFTDKPSADPSTQIPDEDKALLLECLIERKLTNVLKRNPLSCYKVSIDMDSKVYKTVCR